MAVLLCVGPIKASDVRGNEDLGDLVDNDVVLVHQLHGLDGVRGDHFEICIVSLQLLEGLRD